MTFSIVFMVAATMPGQSSITPSTVYPDVRHYKVVPYRSHRGPIRRLWNQLTHKDTTTDEAGTSAVTIPAQTPGTTRAPLWSRPISSSPATPVSKPVPAVSVVQTETPLRPMSKAHRALKPTSSEEGKEKISEARTKLADKHCRHCPDYTWVSGRLTRVHVHGGMWIIRYAPLDKEDVYGGSVVLKTSHSTENYRDGDYVIARGYVVKQDRGTKYVGGALFLTDSLELIERPVGLEKWSK